MSTTAAMNRDEDKPIKSSTPVEREYQKRTKEEEYDAPVHVLSPGPHFLDIHGAFLITFNTFSLREGLND